MTLFSALLLVACSPTIRSTTPAQKAYVASFELSKQQPSVSHDGSLVLNERVHQDMSVAPLTIAFYPPETCLNTSAAPSGSEQRSEVLALDCGVLMTELESQTATAGYDVVSWQLLKDSANPLQQARELGVNMLFEVNELAVKLRDEAQTETTAIRFYEQEDAVRRSPLTVTDARVVGQRCEGAVGPMLARLQTGNRHLFATLSVKLVSVADGRALWKYERSRGGEDRNVQSGLDLYYPAAPLRTEEVPASGRVGRQLLYTGLVALVGSVPVIAARLDDHEELRKWEIALQLGGGGLVVAGVGMTTAANYRRRDTYTYPAADTVLCESGGTTQNPFVPAPQPSIVASTPEDTSGSGYQTRRATSGSVDAVAEQQHALIAALINDFLHELKQL